MIGSKSTPSSSSSPKSGNDSRTAFLCNFDSKVTRGRISFRSPSNLFICTSSFCAWKQAYSCTQCSLLFFLFFVFISYLYFWFIFVRSEVGGGRESERGRNERLEEGVLQALCSTVGYIYCIEWSQYRKHGMLNPKPSTLSSSLFFCGIPPIASSILQCLARLR